MKVFLGASSPDAISVSTIDDIDALFGPGARHVPWSAAWCLAGYLEQEAARKIHVFDLDAHCRRQSKAMLDAVFNREEATKS